jgi:hypothetical protein
MSSVLVIKDRGKDGDADNTSKGTDADADGSGGAEEERWN